MYCNLYQWSEESGGIKKLLTNRQTFHEIRDSNEFLLIFFYMLSNRMLILVLRLPILGVDTV